MKLAPLLVWALITLACCSPVRAGSAVETTSNETIQFDAGRREMQLGAGGFVSFQTTSELRPQINDVGGHWRFGWMLSSPSGEGFWRGNAEFLVVAQGSGIVEGPGSVLAGGSFILRRNFLRTASRWVPYCQVEAGALYNDGYHDRIQHAFGQALEFQVGGGIGLRFLCKDGWAIFGESDFRHISNAGLANRNAGTNAVGGFIGISRFF